MQYGGVMPKSISRRRRDAAAIFVESLPPLYAILADGSCLAPVLDDGDRIVCDTRHKPQAGDYVVIWFRPGSPAGREAWVKLLVAEDNDFFIVEQFNPPRQYRLNRRDVLAMHWCTISACRPRPLGWAFA
jgi:phage repressor protein C with HTH and peptisase S24 domain